MDYRLWSLVMRWMPKWLLAMECNPLHRVFSTFFIFVLHLLKYTTFQTQLQNIFKKKKKKKGNYQNKTPRLCPQSLLLKFLKADMGDTPLHL